MREKKKKNPDEIAIGDLGNSDKGEEIEKMYEENQVFLRPAGERKLSVVIILAIIFGLLSGIVGEIVFKTYLINTGPFRDFNLSGSLMQGQDIVIKEPKKVVVEQDERVSQVVAGASQSVVSIYPKKTGSGPIDRAYLPGEILGRGIVLSNDGWIVTTKDVIGDIKKDYVAVTADGEIYQGSDYLVDSATGAVFFKIKADKLSAAKLGNLENIDVGETVLAVGSATKATLSGIEDINYRERKVVGDFVQSTEKFSKYLLLKDVFDREYSGAPIVNLSGEVVGLISRSEAKGMRLIMPSDNIAGIIAGVLKNKKIVRPYVGMRYIDIASAAGLDESLTGGLAEGTVIYGTDSQPAVEANSPAKKSGLKSGDIVTKVEDQEIGSKNDLTLLIQAVKIGEIIDFTIMRGKEEKVIKVEVGGK